MVFKSFSNKTRFLAFLCQTWHQEEQSDTSICSTKFHFRWWIKQSVLITVTYIALYIWWLVVHLKTAIHSWVLPRQWVMQALGHCHLFPLSTDEIPSAIHSLLACWSWLNNINTLVDFADDGAPIEITNILWTHISTREGCDIDTLRDKTFLNNNKRLKLLKLLPPNENDFQQHIKHATKPSSSLRTMNVL